MSGALRHPTIASDEAELRRDEMQAVQPDETDVPGHCAGQVALQAQERIFARDSDASTTVLPFAVSALTVNGRNRIRRLVLNQPPRTYSSLSA